MMRNSIRLFPPRSAWLLFALLSGADVLLPIDRATAQAANSGAAGRVQGIHVRRTGDMPEARDTAKTMVNAFQAQCGSPLMKQTCQITLSDPAASPKAKSRCQEMMSSFRLNGNLSNVGETVTDEYFAPALGRSVKIFKAAVLRQVGMCEATVAQEEKRSIYHRSAGGYTRYERKTGKSGLPYWTRTEHQYVPGLAGMLGNALDHAHISGKLMVSRPLGHKTYVPARVCEVRKVSAEDGVEFTSCIHETGLKFPSHITFAGSVVSKGKPQLVEQVDAYADKIVLSRDLFFPRPDEKRLSETNRASDPNNPTSKWCAAEKARTGIDPCKDDDE